MRRRSCDIAFVVDDRRFAPGTLDASQPGSMTVWASTIVSHSTSAGAGANIAYIFTDASALSTVLSSGTVVADAMWDASRADALWQP